MDTLFKGIGKHIEIRRVIVIIPLQPRMDNDLAERITIVYLQNIFKLFRKLQPDPCFDGYIHQSPVFPKCLKYLLKKPVQPVRVRKKSASPSLSHHRSGRTAQIQVYLPISEFQKQAAGIRKLPGIIGQDLRHDTDPLIMFRFYLLPVPRL